ncbi:MAG: hypothetical protein H6718_20840 [Polyangiaceae bacterium]|nr:hypothetical protein [Polyangiaceae bacterium]MCB9608813.1 hypothetical protein [Polyangiaceae bacterium]
MRSVRPTWMVITTLLASSFAPLAHAQTSPQDRATAEALFQQAKKLKDAENYEEACPKFAASNKLDPALGTLLNLADCHEQQGLTASAWAEFLEAATLARRAGQKDRADVAQERASALESRLVRVNIVVKGAARIDGLEIKQDGSPVYAATWNTPVPIDPGPHLLSVNAPGKKEWAKAFDVPTTGVTEPIAIEVPELEDAPVEKPPETPVTPAPGPQVTPQPQPGPVDTGSDGSGQTTAGIILAGAGVVGLAVGGVFGLSAKNKWADADCSNGVCPTAERQTLAEDAKSQANLSTLFFAGGGVLGAVGVILLLTAPSKKQAPATGHLQVSPAVGPRATGVWLGGNF